MKHSNLDQEKGIFPIAGFPLVFTPVLAGRNLFLVLESLDGACGPGKDPYIDFSNRSSKLAKEKGASMKLEFRSNRDFWSGLMFLVIGALAILIARDYPFGRALRMGSGYFPTLLGGVLILFGIYIMVKGLRRNEKIRGNWSVRALIVLPVIIVLFGILMERAGFIPALAVLAFGSAVAGNEFKWGEVLLLTAFMTGLSLAVFIWGLGLPYPLIRGF